VTLQLSPRAAAACGGSAASDGLGVVRSDGLGVVRCELAATPERCKKMSDKRPRL
jgi:hypothetical protein